MISNHGNADLEHVPPKLNSMGFDGIHGAFWIGDSIGIDSPLGEGNDACGLLC